MKKHKTRKETLKASEREKNKTNWHTASTASIKVWDNEREDDEDADRV